MANSHLKIQFIIIIWVAVFAVSFAGPPDEDYDESKSNEEMLRDLDSINAHLGELKFNTDSLLDLADSLRHMRFDFDDLRGIPSFREIVIDEEGVIKVLTDTGYVVIQEGTLPRIDNDDKFDSTDYRRGNITKFGKDIIIDEGERLNTDVVLISGDITVNGTIDGDVVVVGGDIYVNSTGYIRGDATTVGGRIKKEEGGKVNGTTLSLGLPFMILPRGSWIQVFEGIQIIVLIIGLFFSTMSISLFPKPVNRISTQLAAHPLKSFIFGYLLYFGAFLVWILLLVSFIGIPLALLGQPIVMMVMVIFGYAAINVVIGEKLFKAKTSLKAFFAGFLVTTCLPFVLLVLGYVTNSLVIFVLNAILLGTLLFVILPFGLGASMLARFGLPKRKKKNGDDNGREISVHVTVPNE